MIKLSAPSFPQFPSVQNERGRLSRRFSPLLVVTCVVASLLARDVQAQQEKTEPAPPALRKDVDPIVKVKFSRRAEEAFRAVAVALPDDASEGERLLYQVQAGRWEDVRDFLKLFEPESGRRIHTRIVSDLAFSNPKSVLLPMEVVRLADASPVELDDKQTSALGRLLLLAMQGSESNAELMLLLTKGTARLGGTDPDRRKAAARILAAAEQWADARSIGLPDKDIRPGVVLAPLPEAAPPESTWLQNLDILRNTDLDEAARSAALDGLYEAMLHATPTELAKNLNELFKDRKQQELTRSVVCLIGEKVAAAGTQVDFRARAVNLEIQRSALEALSKTWSLDESPWQTIANLYANHWHNEAQYTLKTFPTWQKSTAREKYPHVPLAETIASVPQDAWLKAVTPQLSAMIKVSAVRLILLSEDIDRAVPYISELVRHDSAGAAKLANSYLEVWARRHDPNLSADLLKQYKTDSQTIVLTRSEQEAVLRSLGRLLRGLDAPTRKLLDEAQLIRAFDVCHSRAEVYTRQNIVEVFGPLEELSPSLLLTLFERTRLKLASQWRDLSIQRDAATKRTAADVFELVNDGYAEASRVGDQWLAAHPDDWRMNCTAGSLLSDWSEFAYFQAVASEDTTHRFATYLERSEEALARFRASAAAYGALVPKLKRGQFELLPYKAWFYGLLGITHDSGVNLRKGVTSESLAEIRQAMTSLPGGAANVHLEMFSTMVAENVSEKRIAPEMKYRYLSSAVSITGRRETVYPAEEKIQYYDSLLKEVRLQTRIDGSPRINAQGHFGVFVSLVHTADVARESGGFSKYLMNEVQRTVSGKTVTEKPLYRDRFEEALRVAIGDFFEIRSIVFADPNGGARPLASGQQPANLLMKDDKTPAKDVSQTPLADAVWQETPLAYLFLEVKDPTVDRVPALEIDLDFFDREGKVVIPVPSNPLQIEIAADAPARRPATDIAVTQIVDSRELADGRLSIDVIAAAHGLVPEIDELLKLTGYTPKVLEVAKAEGPHVSRLHSGPDGLYAVSERTWTVHLDPTPLLRGAAGRIEFTFPQPTSPEIQVIHRTYQDMDPVDAAATVTLLEGDAVSQVARTNYWLWAAAGSLLVAVAAVILLLRNSTAVEGPAVPSFSLPNEVSPFSIVALLHRIQSSPTAPLSEEQRQSLNGDIIAVERRAFARDADSFSAQDLEAIGRRWLKAVSPSS